MDSSLRNSLRLTVTACRKLLEEEYSHQLEGYYGIQAGMDSASLNQPLGQGVPARERVKILAALRHEVAQGQTLDYSIERFVRESAFTTLNRLAALKLMEHPSRGLVVESVGRGTSSKGFSWFVKISPEALRPEPDGGYQLFLEMLFDDLALSLGTLFDRSLPVSQLFPGPHCLARVLKLLNQPELAPAWDQDETIGWIYQYFTPPELRDSARKASSAPRNSNELAFRNQFYTPRYVVAFLTENTLGRTWFEMRRGATQLVEQCESLIHYKHPIFLKEGEVIPLPYNPSIDHQGDTDMPGEMWLRPNPEIKDIGQIFAYGLTVGGYDYARPILGVECGELANERLNRYRETGKWEGTFEELRCCLFFEQRRYHHFGYGPEGDEAKAIEDLHQAICDQWDREVAFVVHRSKKDPRQLRVLDPACGSGHFLLYSFDLLQTIYQEAYTDPELGAALQQDFPDPEAFEHAIPRLILEHNLYGIDIDLRATQIAALALWLRAQRAWSEIRLPPRKRPRIQQMHVVCAEPMPGEYDLLGEFLRDLKPALIGNIVREVWEHMQAADEIGSLLKIEREIRESIHKAHQIMAQAPEPVQLSLFGGIPNAVQTRLGLLEETDEAFWEHAEERVLEALRNYARQATNGAGVTRQLFSHDAEQGFAFVDLFMQPFDVVLMNPPFGAPSLGSKEYIIREYPRTKNDLYAAFVERGLEVLHPGGYLGAITSRTGFFLKSFQQWREEILLKESQVVAMADLGYGVLDTAMVETAAYILQKQVES